MYEIYVSAPMTRELAHKARMAAARLDITRAEFIRRAVIRFLEVGENG